MYKDITVWLYQTISKEREVLLKMTEKMLTIKEVQERLNVSLNTVNRLIHSGKLPSYKIGKCRRFKANDVEKYINSCIDLQETIFTPRRRGRKAAIA